MACMNELHRALSFKQKCERSDYILRAYLDKLSPPETANDLPQNIKSIDGDEQQDIKDVIVFTENFPTLNVNDNVEAEWGQHLLDDSGTNHCKQEIIDELATGNDYGCDTYEDMSFITELCEKCKYLSLNLTRTH